MDAQFDRAVGLSASAERRFKTLTILRLKLYGYITRRNGDNAIKVYQPLSEENVSKTFIVLLFRKTCCGNRLRRLPSFSDRCRTRLFSECEPVLARFIAVRPFDSNGRFDIIEMREVL